MKSLNIINKSGYSVIISLLMIGFLLVLTTGIFNLILNEMKDNRAMGDYIKAYAGAESARELALLEIKVNGYGYYDKINHDKNDRSILMSANPLNQVVFNPSKDVLISFDIGSKVNEYKGELESLEHDIIPLFYVDDSGEQKTTNITLSIDFGNDSNLAWNIIGKDIGLSGKGSNTIGVKKILTSDGFTYDTQDINNFIVESESNYLHLVNTGSSGVIKYTLNANNAGEYFTKPETTIISSAEVGNYKQNISTDLDNTEFLNILKYSIYSN